MKESSTEFKAWLGKLHGTTMRIALVLHCFEYIERSEYHKISEQTMSNAIGIGRYFRSHAEAAFSIMGLTDPSEVRDAKYILKRIDSTGLMEIKLRICTMFAGIEKVWRKRRNDTRITMPDRARLYPYPEVNTRHTKPAKGADHQKLCM